ncbi:MAG: hypothetical protein ABIP45_07580 [Knoellia sp.]
MPGVAFAGTSLALLTSSGVKTVIGAVVAIVLVATENRRAHQ